jgi:putative FmdB family regulatory protein
MPIYEYVCSACGHRTDILHGVHDAGPHFCPDCGAEGSMRKAFAPPTIVFKGTGWAKRDRRSTTTAPKASSGSDGDGGKASSAPSDAAGKGESGGSGSTSSSGDD